MTSFNPLHCGAVVASRTLVNALRRAIPVSIPFIAGQWSLLAARALGIGRTTMFQSPSLRGSGRFGWRPIAARTSKRVSIPFIAGQWSLRFDWRRGRGHRMVSIPFIAGPWSLRGKSDGYCLYRGRVSIPFIAGQWSLHRASTRCSWTSLCSFNPLHCGAVVASSGSRTSSSRWHASFNPLHCGAVVASGGKEEEMEAIFVFQSPSLRGSGRFARGLLPARDEAACFNPLHCGAVVASERREGMDDENIMFQSPSLRGSGRFWGFS